MTKWLPNLQSRTGPKYRAIAKAIAADIAGGRLTPGERLPPQRELAWDLGVTVGTVSRGYAEAERNGLVKGTVGSGTYILRPGYRHVNAMLAEPEPGIIDMSIAAPAPGEESVHFAAALHRIAEDPKYGSLLDYQPQGGTKRHRAAGAAWLKHTGFDVASEQVVMTAGAQHGIAVIFSALAQAGDRIATDLLTYNGVKPIAALLGIKLEGLAMDEQGLRPDAFEDACRRGGLRALYCIPSGHNPTTAVMPLSRRQEIAEVALRYGVSVVEDDVFAALLTSRLLPLSMMVGDLGYCITGLSKSVAPGLRIGYVSGPASMIGRLRLGVRSTSWSATPLTAEIATQWIEDGTADRILESRRSEAAARLALVKRELQGYRLEAEPGHVFAWLSLPDPWRANDFVAEAERNKILITSSEAFAVGRADPPHAVRLCFGMPATRESLVDGLIALRKILEAPVTSGPPIV